MSPVVLQTLGLGVCTALLVAGGASALMSASVTKRLLGVLIAIVAALLALAALGAAQAATIAGVAVAFAYCVIGVALLVRLQESYGGSDTAEIDAADAQSEPAEPSA